MADEIRNTRDELLAFFRSKDESDEKNPIVIDDNNFDEVWNLPAPPADVTDQARPFYGMTPAEKEFYETVDLDSLRAENVDRKF